MTNSLIFLRIRKEKSTIQAIYKAFKSAIKFIDNWNYTAALCLDFSKAFDIVSHEILIEKLEKHGIRGDSLKLINSFSTGRTQRVVERKKGKMIKSDIMIVKQAVPQGLFWDLYFILYIQTKLLCLQTIFHWHLNHYI